jgi:hypothetical protein
VSWGKEKGSLLLLLYINMLVDYGKGRHKQASTLRYQ